MHTSDKFTRLGGMEALRKISKVFYDKVYGHPWIGKYFESVPQETIEAQQVDFMAQAMGGPQKYCGKFVPQAHAHMMITEELFELRESLLKEALVEAGASEELQQLWLKIDRAFKNKVVKKSESECTPRFSTDEIMNFPNPGSFKKAA